MGSRAQDADKMHMKALKKKWRKQHEAKASNRKVGFAGEVVVMNSLEPTRRYVTEVKTTVIKSGLPAAKEIVCPICGGTACWHKLWEGFECDSGQHDRAIFEVIA